MKLTQALVLFGLVTLVTFQVGRSSAAAPPKEAELDETDTDDVTAYTTIRTARLTVALEACERKLQMELPKVGHTTGKDTFQLQLALGDIKRQAERICKEVSGSLLERAVAVYRKAQEASYAVRNPLIPVDERLLKPDCRKRRPGH